MAEAEGLPLSTKEELLGLLAAVENESASPHAAHTVPATEGSLDADEEPPMQKLVSSVGGLEASHPELVASINQVAATLGKMGI